MNQLPGMTREQRIAALEKAKQARLLRADTKHKLSTGEISIKELILSQEKSIRKMKLIDALKCLPKIGQIKAEKIMNELNIPTNKRIGGLGYLQRRKLVEYLDAKEK